MSYSFFQTDDFLRMRRYHVYLVTVVAILSIRIRMIRIYLATMYPLKPHVLEAGRERIVFNSRGCELTSQRSSPNRFHDRVLPLFAGHVSRFLFDTFFVGVR